MVSGRAVEIYEGRCGSVSVLRLVGPVTDAGLMVHLARELLEARVDGGHIIIDFDGLDIVDPAALSALLARLSVSTGGVPLPAVASDPRTRRLLRDCGSGAAGLACFASVDEAADVARQGGVAAATAP